ncbi:hypothetical protein N7520_001705 [Penicillium odoratum]|uniref:uncharacterized protein n=1 Tax=Penicillium odoratum TaxID=1167516 RepID=UPI0025477D07|nr:uncharacterized protein N7520_001705 [Penicillium odoratum]KAJ5778459.1 hypothetical protein N7520_001705 [Penicillium odoratum]
MGQRFKSSTPIAPSSLSYFCMGCIVMDGMAAMHVASDWFVKQSTQCSGPAMRWLADTSPTGLVSHDQNGCNIVEALQARKTKTFNGPRAGFRLRWCIGLVGTARADFPLPAKLPGNVGGGWD